MSIKRHLMEESRATIDLGEVVDEYRIGRIVLFVALTATIIFGLIWVLFIVMAVGFTLQGNANFGGVLAGTVPITLIFCAAVFATYRVQRTLMRCHENGFVYCDGRRTFVVRYHDISSTEIIADVQRRQPHQRYSTAVVHALRVRLNDEARTEINIRPLLFQDVQRMLRWQSLMRP